MITLEKLSIWLMVSRVDIHMWISEAFMIIVNKVISLEELSNHLETERPGFPEPEGTLQTLQQERR